MVVLINCCALLNCVCTSYLKTHENTFCERKKKKIYIYNKKVLYSVYESTKGTWSLLLVFPALLHKVTSKNIRTQIARITDRTRKLPRSKIIHMLKSLLLQTQQFPLSPHWCCQNSHDASNRAPITIGPGIDPMTRKIIDCIPRAKLLCSSAMHLETRFG